MSIERVERKGGAVVWRVRWRDEQGRNRSKVLGRKRDAEAFDADVRRMKRTRELGRLDAGKQPLAAFAHEWWELHAAPNLAPKTLELYAWLLDAHILPRLGAVQLRDLTPEAVGRFRLDLEADDVGRVSVAKALTLLHGILARAVEWGRVASNPAAGVRKPAAGRRRSVTPLPPSVVERVRAILLADGHLRDATLVSVLAYAGLRPGEALALSWDHVRERTILIDASASLGHIQDTKTKRSRTVQLHGPLREDLNLWHSHRSQTSIPLVFPGKGGEPWTRTTWQNWRRRIYVPAATAAGVTGPRPYDLRHSFVSLLIHEGRSIVDIARQAGHAPTMTLATYAHVFDEFDAGERLPAEQQIQQARDELVPVSYPSSQVPDTLDAENPVFIEWSQGGSNP